MAVYQCPLQANIDSLQATANKLKEKAFKELLNKKGWVIYYYDQNKTLAINVDALGDDYHNFAKTLTQLNYTQHIIKFCEQNIEEEDYVVF
jgi:hypothetical protein